MSLTNAEEPKFEEASPRTPGLGWRIGIITLGVILAVMACGLIVVALGHSTWAISNIGDPGLSPESRSRLEALRAEVDAIGIAPEAVEWMGDALDPNADGTSVLAYLRAAQKALEMADDPKLAEAVKELREIIQTMRPIPIRQTATPLLVPTLEWPSPFRYGQETAQRVSARCPAKAQDAVRCFSHFTGFTLSQRCQQSMPGLTKHALFGAP